MLDFIFFAPFESNFATFLWCAFIGLCFGIFYVYFSAKKKAKYIRILMQNKAFDVNTAISPEIIGNIKMVRGYSEKTENGRIYIPEKYMGKAKFILKNAEAKFYLVLAAIIVLYILILLLHKFVPMYVTNIDSIFNFGYLK